MALKKLGFQDKTVNIMEQVGQVTEGYFLGSREVTIPGRSDPGIIVTLNTSDRGEIEFWAATSLRLLLPQMQEGHYYVITYRGKEKNDKTGRTFHAFDVAEDEGRSLQTASR